MLCLNTLKAGREYTMADLRELKQLQDYGLDSDFYGGRIQYIGKTDTDVLLLIQNRDGLKLIDLAVEKLDDLPYETLYQLAKRKKMKFATRPPKEELLASLTA